MQSNADKSLFQCTATGTVGIRDSHWSIQSIIEYQHKESDDVIQIVFPKVENVEIPLFYKTPERHRLPCLQFRHY